MKGTQRSRVEVEARVEGRGRERGRSVLMGWVQMEGPW